MPVWQEVSSIKASISYRLATLPFAEAIGMWGDGFELKLMD
jgi:hypothetical protein